MLLPGILENVVGQDVVHQILLIVEMVTLTPMNSVTMAILFLVMVVTRIAS